MPITYSFDQQQRLILTKVIGELTLALTQEYFARLQQDTNCPEDAIEIVDFSGAIDFEIHYGEIETITRKYQEAKLTRNIQSTIFDCRSDISYGIARMLKTLHEIVNDKHVVMVTRSQEELTACIDALRSDRAGSADARNRAAV